MAESDTSGPLPNAQALVRELLETHKRHRGEPAAARQAALFKHLDAALAPLPETTGRKVLQDVAAQLEREERGSKSVAPVAETEHLKSEVARLEAQVRQLLKENEDLKQREPQALPSADSGDALPRIREGLSRFLRRDEVPVEALGLRPEDGLFFELCRELIRFALDFETMGVNPIMRENEVGPQLSTLMWDDMQQNVRTRFRKLLEDPDASIDAFRDTLNYNTRFFMYLNLSYHEAIKKGFRAVLEELEHQEILKEHKQLLGHDYGAAWKQMTQIYDDLQSRPSKDVWEQYFLPPFRDKLAAYLEKIKR